MAVYSRGMWPSNGAVDSSCTLRVPMRRAGQIVTGSGGRGPFSVVDGGVLVTGRQRHALYSRDLRSELWLQTGDDRTPDAPLTDGRTYWMGAGPGVMAEFDCATGTLLHRTNSTVSGSVYAAYEDMLVLVEWSGARSGIHGIQRDGREVWQATPAVNDIAWSRDSIVYASLDGSAVECRSIVSGEHRWRFEVPPAAGDVRARGDVFVAGSGQLAVIDQEVVGILRRGEIVVLSLESGELLRTGRPRFVGPFAICVTSDAVLTHSGIEFLAFSHKTMREIEHQEYRAYVDRIYAGQRPSAHALWVTKKAVFWTTADGSVVGVERTLGPPEIWRDHCPGSIMPFGVPPVGHNTHLYLGLTGQTLDIVAWESSAS
jgi:outer membrane protein assembly factor BamB